MPIILIGIADFWMRVNDKYGFSIKRRHNFAKLVIVYAKLRIKIKLFSN